MCSLQLQMIHKLLDFCIVKVNIRFLLHKMFLDMAMDTYIEMMLILYECTKKRNLKFRLFEEKKKSKNKKLTIPPFKQVIESHGCSIETFNYSL